MTKMCGGCDKIWTGYRVCHCAQCHETFGGLTGFNLHLIRAKDGVRCMDPKYIKELKLDKHKKWVHSTRNPLTIGLTASKSE